MSQKGIIRQNWQLEDEYRVLYWRRNELDLIACGLEEAHDIWDTEEYQKIATRMTEIAGVLGYVPAA